MPMLWVKPQPYLNQDVDRHSIRDFETHDCVNVEAPQKGVLDQVSGYTQFGNTLSGSSGWQGLNDYRPSTGGNTLHGVYNGVLYKYVSGTWTSMQTGMSASDKYSFANHLDRHYFANPNQLLAYATTGTKTDVADVKATYLGVVENIMFAANITDSVLGPAANRIIYTAPGTHQFYSDDDGSYAASTQTADIDGEIIAFKIFRRSAVIWTRQDMWIWNVEDLSLDSPLGPQRYYGIGCVSHNAVIEIENLLVWPSDEGYWAWTGKGYPEFMSKYIQTDWDAISDKTGVRTGAKGRQIWCYLGSSVNGYADNVQIFDLNDRNWERRDSHNAEVFAQHIESGSRDLYFGSDDSGEVYKVDAGSDFDGTTITSVYKTKPYDFNEMGEKSFTRIYFLYEALGTSPVMTVNLALNGSNDYNDAEWDVPLPGAATTEQIQMITVGGVKGKSISLKMTNVRKIKEIGFEYDNLGHYGVVPSNG